MSLESLSKSGSIRIMHGVESKIPDLMSRWSCPSQAKLERTWSAGADDPQTGSHPGMRQPSHDTGH